MHQSLPAMQSVKHDVLGSQKCRGGHRILQPKAVAKAKRSKGVHLRNAKEGVNASCYETSHNILSITKTFQQLLRHLGISVAARLAISIEVVEID